MVFQMTKKLVISNKLLSLRGQVNICNEEGNPIYLAKGEFALISPTWRILFNDNQVASIRRKILSFFPKWIIQSDIGAFTIRRKLLSITRKYIIEGGDFDGTTLNGNIWDLRFNILNNQSVIAQAAGKILTLRDTHCVELLQNDLKHELFTVIAMVTMQIDRRDQAKKKRSANDD
jgi:Uncharacterized conserved protein